MIFGCSKWSHGAPRGPFWEAPKIEFFNFWGSQKAPFWGRGQKPPPRKKGLPARSSRHFFWKSASRLVPGGGVLGPPKNHLGKKNWHFFGVPSWVHLGSQNVRKMRSGKIEKNELFEKLRGMHRLRQFSAGGWGFPIRSLREQARKPGQKTL